MKLFLLWSLLLGLPLWLGAQTPDSLKTKLARPARTPSTPDNITRTNGLESYMNSGQMMGRSINAVVIQMDNRYEGLKGTPYFLPDWSAGEVELNGGINYKNPQLKFDAARQNLLVKDPRTGDSVIVDSRQIVRFVLYQRDAAQRDAAQPGAAQTNAAPENATAQTRSAWLFRRYADLKTDEKDLGSGYFLVLYEGKTTLLKQVKKIFKKADYKDPYSNNVRYDSYDDDATYYLLRSDHQLTRVKRSKKALFDALADQKAALTAFADEQKLSGKTDGDLIKLVQFYDRL
jgi:hypothetical protein